jgi:Chaperone of endosialidase
MTITLDGTLGITSPAETTTNLAYTGTLTGGTGVVNLGSGQVYKDASGNVGIGTNSPATKLHLATAANTGLLISSTDGTTLKGIAFNTSDVQFNVGTLTNHPLGFLTNNTERMRIDSSGNLLVGTTSAQGILTIKQSSNSYTGCLTIVDSTSANKWGILLDSGTTNLYFGYNGASKSYINSSTGAFVAVSDLRAKKDIVDSKYGLAEILQLRSVEYLMLEEDATAKKHLGLIAQEVKAVIDEAVDDVIDEETLMGLDKSGLVPVLIKAIQELKAIIDTQQARIEALEAA